MDSERAPIGVLSFEEPKRDGMESLTAVSGRLAGAVARAVFSSRALSDFSLACFVASETVQPSTAVVRRRRLWGTLDPFLRTTDFPGRSPDPEFVAPGGHVRFAGLLRVEKPQLVSALELSRGRENAALLLFPHRLMLSAHEVAELYAGAFPSKDRDQVQTRFDWRHFVRAAAAHSVIVGRVVGNFDDRSVAADLFGSSAVLEQTYYEITEE